VAEAATRLGIRDPVHVSITDYWGGEMAGRLIGFRAGSWRLGVDTHLSAAQASRTLWHELMHVVQAQDAGGLDQFDARVVKELRAAGLLGRDQRRFARHRAYNRIPTEREAESAARRWDRQLSLAVAR
jgi:hypothetical protein